MISGKVLPSFNGTCREAHFSPLELANITGFAQTLQRVWRRRGYMPALTDGTARFRSLEVAELFVRHQLSLYGVPPSDSSEVGPMAGRIAIWYALLDADGACEIIGPAEAVKSFIHQFRQDHDLADEIADSPDAKRFLCSGEGGELTFVDDICSHQEASQHVSALCIDLQILGSRLAASAGRPLIGVDIPVEGSSGQLRRLTSGREIG